MYKITIKNQSIGTFSYAQVKTIEKDKVIYVDFETEDIEEVKAKFIELLEDYKIGDLNISQDVTETDDITINIPSNGNGGE